MKKLFSILLALTLVLGLSSIVLAADITVSGGAEGSVYAAYKLLNASEGDESNFAYTLNEKYADLLTAVTGMATQAEINAYIEALDASATREFANAMYNAIKAADPAIAADYTSTDAVFEGVEQGYYLIAETALGNEQDTFSLVMLKTAGKENVMVFTKEDVPTVVKKVKETNDSTNFTEWGDSADYDFGDTIEYSIEGTVSDKYAEYKSYYYSFNDTMEKGLTYNEDAKIYVINGDDKIDVTEQFKITVSQNEESGLANGFVAEANLKELAGVEINDSTIVRVEYTVTLNEYAVAGPNGNKNFVYIEYENDPLHEADGDVNTTDRPGEDGEGGEGGEGGDDDENGPSKTPIDINIVFTFNAVINKVDKDGNALEGAGFTLYKWVKTDNGEDWVKIGEEISGVTTFTFEKLDAGIYKLEESTVPNGYNKCADIEFEVVGEYDLEKDPPELTNLLVKNAEGAVISDGEDASFAAVLSEGAVYSDVVNLTGGEFPETGGIGRTIFYIVGAVLALGAIVLLVAKKRMRVED